MRCPVINSHPWLDETGKDHHEDSNLPIFVIVHRFWKPGSVCLAGEEVGVIWLAPPGLVQLRLSLALRLEGVQTERAELVYYHAILSFLAIGRNSQQLI